METTFSSRRLTDRGYWGTVSHFLLTAALITVSTSLRAQSNPRVGTSSSGKQNLSFSFSNRTKGDLFGAASHTSAIPQASEPMFASPVGYDSGGYESYSVAVADVNGDGIPDLIVANSCASVNSCSNDGTVAVLLGNGNGTFQNAVTYDAGGPQPLSLVVTDVNGDGHPDIVVVVAYNSSATVSVLLGNGNGTFQSPLIYAPGGLGEIGTFGLAVADVNADGKPDVIVPMLNSGMVGVLLGNGDGTFQNAVTYDSGGTLAFAVAVADVNGDGKPDIVVGSNVMGVLLGNGDGTFQSAIICNGGGGTPVVADVNHDGKPDIVLEEGNGGATTVGVYLGNGDGTFQTETTYNVALQSFPGLAIADLNGDGNLDVALSGGPLAGTDNGQAVGVLLGNGDGTFQNAALYTATYLGFAGSLAVADVNGDGRPDVIAVNQVVGNNDGALFVLINTSLGPTTTTVASSLNPSAFGQSVTLTADVSIQGFEGPPGGSIQFLDGSTSLGTVALNSSGSANLTSSSLAVGTHTITAAYSGSPNFAASTSQVLSQMVQGAILSLSTTKLSFGNQTLGIPSTAQAVTLTNSGNVSLTIKSLSISGKDLGDFSQTNNCGSSVAAGATCTILVVFSPIATGVRTAAVNMTDSGTQKSSTVALSGTGVLPTVSLLPASLTFPTQVVFTTSKTKTITLKNSGLGILTISAITLSGQFAQTNTCGSTLSPTASCTFNVAFKPTTEGTVTGSISLTDNAANSPQTVSLKGTGTYIQLTPSSENFGNQPIGTKSLPKTITLSNKGSVTVSIISITVAGADASDFAQTNTCGSSVAAGASCFIKVTFTPTVSGARSASISVSDNGGGSPQTVNLVGTGTE